MAMPSDHLQGVVTSSWRGEFAGEDKNVRRIGEILLLLTWEADIKNTVYR